LAPGLAAKDPLKCFLLLRSSVLDQGGRHVVEGDAASYWWIANTPQLVFEDELLGRATGAAAKLFWPMRYQIPSGVKSCSVFGKEGLPVVVAGGLEPLLP
jgi:hypothetical protein